MGIIDTYNCFKPLEGLFRCPLCGGEMVLREDNSLVCGNGHCFNLSRHGYVNFASGCGKTKYTKELFVSRRCIFQAGFYDPLKERVRMLAEKYTANRNTPMTALDAGCGEGFFASELTGIPGGRVFALDLFKEAIILGAKENRQVRWIVGDLSNIPLKTGTVDLLLNVFAPANYSEFLRVLSSGGIIVKIVPGEGYLSELREFSGAGQYSNRQVVDYFCKNMTCLERHKVYYQMPVTELHMENFIRMTPLMFDVDKTKPVPEKINQITIEAEILVGEAPNATTHFTI